MVNFQKVLLSFIGLSLIVFSIFLVIIGLATVTSLPILYVFFPALQQFTTLALGLGVLELFIALVIFLIGIKFYWENYNFLVRTILALIGIITILIGVIIMVATIETIIGFFAGLIVVALGITLLKFGWGVSTTSTLGKLVSAFSNTKRLR